jgi:hypothetical protein
MRGTFGSQKYWHLDQKLLEKNGSYFASFPKGAIGSGGKFLFYREFKSTVQSVVIPDLRGSWRIK